jgi:signal transduction histidine kinase
MVFIMVVAISPYAFVGVNTIDGKPNPIPGPGLALFLISTIFLNTAAAYLLIKKMNKALGVVKQQLRFITAGILLMHLFIISTILVPLIFLKTNKLVYFFPLYTLIFLGMTSYAIVKHRFLDIRFVIARSVSYILLFLIISLIYASWFVLSTVYVTHQNISVENLAISVVLSLILASSYQPLNRVLAKITDNVFYRDRYNVQNVLLKVSTILSSTLSLTELVDHALREIMSNIRISQGYIVLTKNSAVVWSEGVGKTAKWPEDDKSLGPLLLKAMLTHTDENILIFDELPEGNEKEVMRERELSIILPLIVKDEVIGGVLLGDKSSGNIYSIEDIGLLKILAPAIALAVKNAESYEEIRRFNVTLEKKVEQATKVYKEVNEDVYKKNLELAERNRTLSLLRQIDVVVLSTVTDTSLVAQQVANLIVREMKFKMVMIYMIDRKENAIIERATAPLEIVTEAEEKYRNSMKGMKISLYDPTNVVAHAVKDRTSYITNNLSDILSPAMAAGAVEGIKQTFKVETTLVYPFIVRDEVIGAMVIGIEGAQSALSPYHRDLIDRLSGVIGIALDNALLYQKIQEANERLKQIDYLKDEFVSVASHELRTPMTSIRSYLWLALANKGGELTEKQRYYIERSYNSTTRLIKLVNDMLNVSRIESGRMSFEIQTVDMNTLIKDVIGEVEPRANELEVNIVFKPVEGIPVVLADPDKIKEVVINLIGNSLKFTPKGGDITITYEQKDGMLITHVKDTGEGIAEEDISKLFQKFSLIKGSYQTNQRASQGTGLGLYISKSIMKQHKGDIWAESEGRGKGATMSFSLKINNEADYQWFKDHSNSAEGLGIIHTEI